MHIVDLSRAFKLRAWSFPVPFAKNSIIYFVKGERREQPLSNQEALDEASQVRRLESVLR